MSSRKSPLTASGLSPGALWPPIAAPSPAAPPVPSVRFTCSDGLRLLKDALRRASRQSCCQRYGRTIPSPRGTPTKTRRLRSLSPTGHGRAGGPWPRPAARDAVFSPLSPPPPPPPPATRPRRHRARSLLPSPTASSTRSRTQQRDTQPAHGLIALLTCCTGQGPCVKSRKEKLSVASSRLLESRMDTKNLGPDQPAGPPGTLSVGAEGTGWSQGPGRPCTGAVSVPWDADGNPGCQGRAGPGGQPVLVFVAQLGKPRPGEQKHSTPPPPVLPPRWRGQLPSG